MDTLTAQILEFWKDELVPQPSALLDKFNLPEETRELLQKIGLPSKGARLGAMLKEALLHTYYSDPNRIQKYSHHNQSFIVIGDDSAAQLCINEPTGEIFLVDLRFGLVPTTFINSSLKTLLTFLAIELREWFLIDHEPDESEMLKKFAKIRAEFDRIDPKALENEDYYWPGILDSVEGLL